MSDGDATDPPPRPPPLDYARPGPVEEPTYSAVVEAAIDRGEPLRAIAPLLLSNEVAARYLARSIGERCPYRHATVEPCAACGATRGRRHVLLAVWKFSVPAPFFDLTGRNPETGGVAVTCHGFCERCAAAGLRATRIAWLLRMLGWVAAVSTILCLMSALAHQDRRGNPSAWMMRGAGGSAIVLIAAFVSAEWTARRSVPRALRRFLPRWLRFSHWRSGPTRR